MDMNKCSYFSDNFKDCLFSYISENELKKRTVDEYIGFIRILCNFCKKDFLELDDRDVDVFFIYMKKRIQAGTLQVTTYNSRLSCYRNLALHIVANHPELNYHNPFVFVNPMEYDYHIKPSTIPSLSNVDAVLSASKNSPMYFLILSLAFRAAMTASDIISMLLSNVFEFEGNMCIVFPDDKNGKDEKVIRLPEDVGVLLKNYIDTMPYVDEEGHLFYNKHLNPLTLRNLDAAVERFISASGIDSKIRFKDLRARAILDMVHVSKKEGLSLDNIKEYARIGEERMFMYERASHLVADSPAELVNIRVARE